ncbi:cation:proton antiporter [Phosphitispora sp. TUW77]|uniref:cation:proton antiporter domain-containing protein n=1 Tax=Phosphitispora sp. TUW77 TaxID=3152361 RepID=UPI003AB6AE52
MEIPILKGITIIFALSVVVLFIFHRLRIPAVVGFLLTGILAGPHGFKLVNEVHQVEMLAEIGIVLLLFTIGIEFSFNELLQIRKSVLMGGSLQVVLTSVAAFGISAFLGYPLEKALFIGFLISLSSTAIVLRLFQERAELDSPHGRATLGILIFQDFAIVPMILFTPLLSGQAGNLGNSLIELVAKGLLIVILVIVNAKWIVPYILYQAARTRNREIFLLSIVVICLAVAWLTSSVGLSLALGAFLAGLIISESDYSHQALGSVLPFRDVFTSFFFVSIGMLLDIAYLLQQPLLVAAAVIGVMLLKTIMGGFTALLMGFPIRSMILTGFALSQVGEFSFILSRSGVEYGLLTGGNYQLFLAVSILTMAGSPFVLAIAHRAADLTVRLPLSERIISGKEYSRREVTDDLKNHLVILGFGINGRNVARAAAAASIPYMVIEMNPDTVRDERKNDEPIYYGDATHEAVLQHANIKEAKVAVVAISDPVATRRIIEVIRRLNKDLCIIVRTRYVQELEELFELGANEVIPEEFETSVEIFTRVLNKYLVPRTEIERFISEVRSDTYEMFRSYSRRPVILSELKLQMPDFEIATFRIYGDSKAAGKNLQQIELRKKYGVTMLAIGREGKFKANPHGQARVLSGDVAVIAGPREKVARVAELFSEE